MRPVNLIPPEERHGSQSPLRTGPLPYIVLGALVLLLLGVALLVTTGNEISEKKDEVTSLKRENAAAEKRAQELAPFVQFAEIHRARVETVSSLADSRFDWERVMRELSKVLPPNVWLTSINASASAESASDSGASEASGGSALRGSVAGPALEISGCSTGQDGVAGFVTALKQIDGVTRVGVENSALPPLGGGEGGGGGGGGATDCRTRKFIAQFQLVVAFDAAPVPPPTEGTTEVATEAPPAEGEPSSESTSSSEG